MLIPTKKFIIELIYESGCPNVQQARDVITRACETSGLPVQWQEWDINDPQTPQSLRHFGSPSILVAGKDVASAGGNDCACCRVYPENFEFIGCPALADVVSALRTLND